MQSMLAEFRSALLDTTESNDTLNHTFQTAKTLLSTVSYKRTTHKALQTLLDTTDISPSTVHIVLFAVVIDIRPVALLDPPVCTPTSRVHTHHQRLYTQLLHLAHNVVRVLTTTASPPCPPPPPTTLQHHIDTFATHLEQWKASDIHFTLQLLANAWVNIEFIGSVIAVSDATKRYSQLEQQLKSIGQPHEALEPYIANCRASVVARVATQDILRRIAVVDRQIATLSSPPASPSATSPSPPPAFEHSIDTIVRRAFWDAFVARLDDDRHTDQLQLLLDELRTKLKRLTPHRTDLHHDIDTAIDTQLLVQMVEHECMDITHFLRTTDFVVGHLRRTQAPARDEPNERWHREWRANVEKGCGGTFARAFATFLEFVHREVDTVLTR